MPRSAAAIGSRGRAEARLLFEDDIKGIVELGSLEPFSEQHREYLEAVAGAIGIAIQTVQSRERTQQLLEESQRLSAELQAQQEELRAANEELEEQTQRLEESEERLKAQQDELEVTNEELEEKNDLLERQKREVERARKDVEEKAAELALASKYKSEFLANMSHELRSPLNSLLLLAQGLAQNKQGNLSPEQVESAKIIHGSGNDLLNLINEILDLSRIEAGRMDLHLGTVRISDLAEGVQTTFGHMAQDKGPSLEVVVREDAPPEITSDRQRIEQILRNLMSNALKFTEQGGVSVTFGIADCRFRLECRFRQSQIANRKSAIRLTVEDHGPGIPDNVRERMFDPFYTTNPRDKGTGLGLSISHGIVKDHHGELSVESKLGEWTRFQVDLPLDNGWEVGDCGLRNGDCGMEEAHVEGET